MSELARTDVPPKPASPVRRPPLAQRSAVADTPSVRAALYVFIATLPFEAFPIGEFLAGRFSLARAVGYVFFMVALLHPRTALRRPRAAVVWFGVWIAVLAMWIPFQSADVAQMSLRHVLQLLQMLVLLWITSNVLGTRRALRTSLMVLVCSCAALALVQMAGGGTELAQERISAFGENPNTVGASFALAVIGAIGLARDLVTGWRRIFVVLLSAPLLVQLVRTGSRAAMLALVGGIVVMMIRSRGLGGKAKAIVLAIPLLSAFVYVAASSEAVVARTMQAVVEGRFARREYIVPATLGMIRERPLLGWGPEQHLLELGSRLNRDSMDEHNLYLWVLNEGGLAAFLPFLIAVLLVVRDADRGRDTGRGTVVLALVATLAIANMAHSHHNRKINWVVIGMAVSTPLLRRRGVAHRRPVIPVRAQ